MITSTKYILQNELNRNNKNKMKMKKQVKRKNLKIYITNISENTKLKTPPSTLLDHLEHDFFFKKNTFLPFFLVQHNLFTVSAFQELSFLMS